MKVSGGYDGAAVEDVDGAFAMQYEGVFEISKVWFARKRTPFDCNVPRNPAN